MGRKPTTLWRPESVGEKPSYTTCAEPLCLNVVGKEGDRCPDHQDRPKGRPAGNVRFF